ncbi:cGMP-dependent protein kinase 1-like [Lingula anatina]|uniref:cGMP-dependent protein kinase 1-like n=1 Tax=Lingula anatina TaxID=7574 RepID=A0A2R2MSR6_LINAN|nr:cGMP-dependent protein kinase 1-like [Lingula anatina]|eukprot:XP_023933047.1 cGMP-dependent protein kinase 1-like [Lingula anatina]
MGSLQDLQKLLRMKDDQIRELQLEIEHKNGLIQELRSQLDKYQSVFGPKSPKFGPRKQRAQGISAEPQQAQRTVSELTRQKFRKYSKSPR